VPASVGVAMPCVAAPLGVEENRAADLHLEFAEASERPSERQKELWTDRLAAALTAEQCGFLKDFIEHIGSYASDCSGANAPWHALVDLQILVQPRKKARHKFASEAPGRMGDGGRLFMTLNHPPEMMLSDMLHRPARRNESGELVLQSYCSYRQT